MMKKNNWTLYAALAVFGLLAVAAFQNQTPKFGVVNLSTVADKSKLGQREKDAFNAFRTKANNLLTFVNNNKVMTAQQRDRLISLWLKDNPTAAETQELEQLKSAIQTASSRYAELVRKSNPTPDELQELSEKSALAGVTQDILPQLQGFVGQELQARAEQKQTDVLAKARAAAAKYGKEQGFSVIFDQDVAPYAANDVTDEVVKVMDRDNP
ncbi:MAG: OmpH family outer membrane protein [Armatimonadetes bacterium]|nr:MAG: OmpH family outer membrane protein [Armatimonadota bacterium]